MRHPHLSPARRVVATVPALCDGLNVGTAPFLIGDKQCTDSENMWWERGALRCRKGFTTTRSRISFAYADQNTQYFTDADGWVLALSRGDYESGADVWLNAYDKQGNATSVTWLQNGNIGLAACLAPVGGEWRAQYSAFLFLNNGTIIGVKASQNRFDDITDKVYVPLRMANGTPVTTRTQATLTGDLLEGHNLLGAKFRCTFTTDGSGVYYYVPTVRAYSPLTVTVTLDGVSTTWSLSSADTVSEEAAGMYLYFDRQSSCFWFSKDGVPCALKAGESRQNLTAVCEHSCKHSGLPFSMKTATWFGGTAGGTRLFLGGDEQGYIAWSDLENPLYFPESNYAAVGTPGSPVVAFGKQGALLVLFKEHELYAAEYTAAEKITAEDVQSGEVTDITATALFPLTALHAEIGCDLPQTIALYGNRLWWACRDGSVYALQSTGSLSQRNVTRLSVPIEPLLRQNGAPQFASAAVYRDRYYLLWNNDVFTAIDDTTPAWYRFSTVETGAQPVSLFVKGDVLYMPASYRVGTSPVVALFALQGDEDTRLTHTGTSSADAVIGIQSVPIRGMVCTKQYDFGTPEKRKTVTRLFAEASAKGQVAVSYVTEHGEAADLPHPSSVVEGIHTTPHGVRCRRLGIKFEGEQLVLNSVTVRLKEET